MQCSFSDLQSSLENRVKKQFEHAPKATIHKYKLCKLKPALVLKGWPSPQLNIWIMKINMQFMDNLLVKIVFSELKEIIK